MFETDGGRIEGNQVSEVSVCEKQIWWWRNAFNVSLR